MSPTNHLEIVAFYPDKIKNAKELIDGSVHVRLKDKGLDIRGCKIYKTAKIMYASFPHKEQFDPKENKIAMFPLFNFEDPIYNAEIKSELIRKCALYIHENKFEDCDYRQEFLKAKGREIKKKFSKPKFPGKPKFNNNKPSYPPKKSLEPIKTEVIGGKVWTEYKPRKPWN